MADMKKLVETRIKLLGELSSKEAEKKSVQDEIKRVNNELEGIDQLLEEALEE